MHGGVGHDQTQENLIGELLKAGAVYKKEYTYPVDFGINASQKAKDPEILENIGGLG